MSACREHVNPREGAGVWAYAPVHGALWSQGRRQRPSRLCKPLINVLVQHVQISDLPVRTRIFESKAPLLSPSCATADPASLPYRAPLSRTDLRDSHGMISPAQATGQNRHASRSLAFANPDSDATIGSRGETAETLEHVTAFMIWILTVWAVIIAVGNTYSMVLPVRRCYA